MLERPFSDEEDSTMTTSAGDNQEPEYAFEGYTIESSEKISLTHPQAELKPSKIV
jgi:hypothetical protein